MSEPLLNQPIVLDNGSGTLKTGFAGEDIPLSISPTIIGKPKYSKVMAGALEGDTFIGNKAQEHRGLLTLRHPIEHGIVENWDDIELIWQHIFSTDLKTNVEDHPILLTEAPLNPKKHRDKCAEILFEQFNCPALYLSIQAILALYASGKTTGVVLDSGDGVSHVVPVYQGFSLPNAIQRIDVAGRDITEQLQLLLRKQGILLQSSSEKEIVRLIKEKFCCISLNPKEDEDAWSLFRHQFGRQPQGEEKLDRYKLPDGQVIEIGAERFRASEILFQPDIIGVETPGLHQMMYDSLQKTDMDLRSSLYQNIVLSGGTTLLKSFGDRLINELKELAPQGTKIKILAPPERKYSTWIGGSILASLSTFKKMWVSKKEWEENPDILHKKCL